jgi:hypothetical protein
MFLLKNGEILLKEILSEKNKKEIDYSIDVNTIEVLN